MGHSVTIGGERLGSGKKMKAELHGYERSTHDIGYVWRSTMASGTLVPFMSELALPGDTFDINLDVDVLTHPTIGPLFGSYKIQLDVFQIPIRLYNSKLHMNLINVGMEMNKVAFPQLELKANGHIDPAQPIDNQQINASCIFSYLGIRGLGATGEEEETVTRRFNAIPYLGYWDIYKNYYANKQEEIGALIHKNVALLGPDLTSASLENRGYPTGQSIQVVGDVQPPFQVLMYPETNITIVATGLTDGTDVGDIKLFFTTVEAVPIDYQLGLDEIFNNIVINAPGGFIFASDRKPLPQFAIPIEIVELGVIASGENTDVEPQVRTFPLVNIDNMRKKILQWFSDAPYIIDITAEEPYVNALLHYGPDDNYSKKYSQEGLGLKTYNSDLFNNWIETEWIDGSGGINEITAISTAGASFTLDELNLKQKIYDMLNRIAISGGSYEDWLSAVYDHDKPRTAENPMYLGGLIRNLVFEEVISNAASENQPLGTLAGRGRMGSKKKGGQITAKINEPSYLMGIISLTPNLDYSQGNKWDMNLKTMDDLHKPALDEIGFQDLITDQMAWWDTDITTPNTPTFKSAGKQPAWINYMTNVNQVRGNFADQTQQMFMTLNRRYSLGFNDNIATIADVTTYIDPSKFNNIFADTARDAQNFWTQIGVDITARRKMSAKVIPNL